MSPGPRSRPDPPGDDLPELPGGDLSDPGAAAASDARALADRLAGRTALVAALALHLAVGSFVLPVGRVAPVVAALGLGALWVAVGVAIVRHAGRRPLLTLLLPFVVAAAWWLTLTLGTRVAGW